MKKLMVIAILLFATVTMTAQKRFEDNAKATIKEMSEVVKLSQEQSDKLYANEMQNNIKKAAVRQENTGNQDKIQEGMKAANKESNDKIKEILGEADTKIWSDYQKEKRAKQASAK